MTGPWPKADVEHWARRQHRKLDALHQTKRARKLAEQKLCRKGSTQHQRYGVEA
jgi:hypothetical protein